MPNGKQIKHWNDLRGSVIESFNYEAYQNSLVFKMSASPLGPGTAVIYLQTCCSEFGDLARDDCGEIWVEHIDAEPWLEGMRIERMSFESVNRLSYGTRSEIDTVFYLTIEGRRTVGELAWSTTPAGCTIEIRHSSKESGHVPEIPRPAHWAQRRENMSDDDPRLYGKGNSPLAKEVARYDERASRLAVLVSKGHGNCIEAIKLEPDVQVRLRKLYSYVGARPNITQRRQAKRLIAALEKETSVS